MDSFDMGQHLIIDLFEAQHLDSEPCLMAAIDEIIAATGATLLHCYFHRFDPHGITGMACLAESHISVHTWPESGTAAFDIYMCGPAVPERALPILEQYFKPKRMEHRTLYRGQLNGVTRLISDGGNS
jgi:S-adenosylmethionine decarboxylase